MVKKLLICFLASLLFTACTTAFKSNPDLTTTQSGEKAVQADENPSPANEETDEIFGEDELMDESVMQGIEESDVSM